MKIKSKKVIKQYLSILLLFTSVSFSFESQAGHVGECIQYAPNDHQTDVVISYMHATVGSFNHCVGNSEWSPEEFNPYWRDVRAVLQRMSQFRIDLDKQLTARVKAAAIEGIGSAATVTSANIYVSGEVKVTLKGQPDSNGMLDLTIGGFGLAGTVNFQKNWVYDGSIKVSANNLQFTARYNVNTGEVTLVEPENNYISIKIDLTSPIAYLLPPLLLAVEGIEDMMESDAQYEINHFLETTSSSYSQSIFSLDEEIPSGEFVYNGVDYGDEVKNQLIHFVEDIDISISQYGKTIDDSYININLQNLQLTVGRKLFESKFNGCARCEIF